MTILKSIKKFFYTPIFIFSLISCSDSDTLKTTNDLSEEEAAELIQTSLQQSTGGLNEITKMYSEELTTDITLNETCNTLYEENFPYTFNGNLIEAEYDFNWSYELSCNNLNIPVEVDFNATSLGTYTTKRVKSEDKSEASFNISGLQPSADYYLFEGDYKRDGDQEITINLNTRTITSSIYLETTDLTVDKVDNEIISGSATLTLTGKTSEEYSFYFEATIVFNGKGTATVTINETVYDIDIN